MSFRFKKTVPDGYEVKVFDDDIMRGIVILGQLQIPMQELCDALFYVLTASDLAKDDPRRELVRRIKSMEEVEGNSPGKKRLQQS